MSTMNLLSFENLRIPLGSGGREVRVSSRLPMGGVLSIRGTSGAGKSTLLRILGRLEDRFTGDICWEGRNIRDVPAAEWRRSVQYVHQDPVSFPGTVRENLLMPWKLSAFRNFPQPGTERVKLEMEALGLNRELLEQDAQLLSGGEKARLALLRHLLSAPRILLLDEPTASLDPENRKLILGRLLLWLLEIEGRGIALISHNAEDSFSFPADRVSELLLTPKELKA